MRRMFDISAIQNDARPMSARRSDFPEMVVHCVDVFRRVWLDRDSGGEDESRMS